MEYPFDDSSQSSSSCSSFKDSAIPSFADIRQDAKHGHNRPVHSNNNYNNGDDETKHGGSAARRNTKSKKGKKGHHPHTLDHLAQHVADLTSEIERRGLFLPLPDEEDGNGGKVWSNRNYGGDKKRQRKAAERTFLEGRISQLDNYLDSVDERCGGAVRLQAEKKPKRR